jgi:tRNA(Ile)-lysidine synthase
VPKTKKNRAVNAFSAANLLKKLNRVLRENTGIVPGDRIGVAVSGGADSVALLLLLLELRQKLSAEISVLHFNHKLRGIASDHDEKFVAALAKKHQVQFFVQREDIAAKAKAERGNLEDAGRRARYAFFAKLVHEHGLKLVAVAHTADDQAETVLAHILRGTGLAGLGGIHPRAGIIFRPLLEVRRSELRDYLKTKRQAWREDASNRDVKRMRARIRRKLLPFLEKQFQPGLTERLSQLAALAREDEAFLDELANLRMLAAGKFSRGEFRISIKNLLQAESGAEQIASVGKRMIRLIVQKIKLRPGQLSAAHVQSVLELARKGENGKALQLPGGAEVRREKDALKFLASSPSRKKTQPHNSPAQYAYELNLALAKSQLHIVELSLVLHFRVIDWPAEGRETIGTEAVLDLDRLQFPCIVRNWKPADVMRPVGHQKAHKLARLLNEIGASRWDKLSWPVLYNGGQVAWVRGLPVASELAVSSATRKAVVITEEPAS